MLWPSSRFHRPAHGAGYHILRPACSRPMVSDAVANLLAVGYGLCSEPHTTRVRPNLVAPTRCRLVNRGLPHVTCCELGPLVQFVQDRILQFSGRNIHAEYSPTPAAGQLASICFSAAKLQWATFAGREILQLFPAVEAVRNHLDEDWKQVINQR